MLQLKFYLCALVISCYYVNPYLPFIKLYFLMWNKKLLFNNFNDDEWRKH